MSGGGSGPQGGHIEDGHAFENWTVVGHVADGGFAAVYRARYTGLRPADFPPMAALKAIVHLTPADREQLREEYEAARQLAGHPHIVEVFDVFEAPVPDRGRCVILVQELAEHSLRDQLLRSGPLGRPELMAVAADVARGIDGVHAARIIHCDLKPANVLAFGHRWKIADLGTASLITSGTMPVGGTKAPLRGGTFWYSPPEYAVALLGATQPPPNLHRDADVWSFGVLLHEAATGSHPFADASDVLAGRPTIDPTVPDDIRAVIESCLSPSGIRPRHGAELLQLLDDRGLLPLPPTQAVARKPPPGSPPGGSGSVTTLTVPPGGFPLLSSVAPTPAAPTPAPPTPAPPASAPPLTPAAGSGPVALWGRRARWGAVTGALVLMVSLLTWGFALRDGERADAGPSGPDTSTGSSAGAVADLAGPAAVTPALSGCVTTPAYVSIDKATVIGGLADAFNRSALAGETGACIQVVVRSHTSGDVACWYQTEAGVTDARGCDPASDGGRAVAADVAEVGPPSLYLPAASSFGNAVLKAAPGRLEVLDPSIATTEVVLAGKQTVFDVVAGCGPPLDSVARLVAALDDPCVTGALGHRLRLGKTNPFLSASGYGSTMLIASHSLGGAVTVTGLRTDADAAAIRSRVERAVVHYGASGPAFLREAQGDASYVDIALLARKAILDFNDGDPTSNAERADDGSLVVPGELPAEPLVAVTPTDGVVLSDNPVYLSSGLDAVVAAGLRRFAQLLAEPWAQSRLGAYHFGPPASDPSIPGPQVPPADADTAQVLLARWADAERKPVRALFAVDISTSMTACGEDRLGQVRDSLVASLQELSANDRVAVVPFSSDGAGTLRFPVSGAVYRSARDPASFAAATNLMIDPSVPNTPLFSAASEAVASLADTADGATIDVVVLLTDGVNDPTGTGGCTPPPAPAVPADLLADLSGTARGRGVRLFAIAYGAGADLAGVSALAEATGGSASAATGPEALTEVYRRLITEF